MDRLFDEMLGRGARRSLDESWLLGPWKPAVDIKESSDEITISVDLPGFKAEDVEVKVDNGVLSLRGERKFEEASEGESYHRVERRFGVFERSFTLPRSIDASKVEARFKDGEMTIVMPRLEDSKPRSIKVEVESD
jgi:HSP20 family protein